MKDLAFPVLTFVSQLLRTAGWLLVVGGLLFAVVAGLLQPNEPGRQRDMLELVAGGLAAFLGLIIVAVGESVGVLFAIESNTRKAASLLAGLEPTVRQPTSNPPGAG